MGKKIDRKIVKLLLGSGKGIIEGIEDLMNQLRTASERSNARYDSSHKNEMERLTQKHEQQLRLGEVEIQMAQLRLEGEKIRHAELRLEHEKFQGRKARQE